MNAWRLLGDCGVRAKMAAPNVSRLGIAMQIVLHSCWSYKIPEGILCGQE